MAVGLVDSPSALGVALAGGSNDHRLVVPIRAVAGTGGANAARLPVRGGSCCLLDAARMVSTRLCTFGLGWLESEMVMIIYIVKRQGGGVVAVYSDGLKAAAADHATRINGELEEKDVTLREAVDMVVQAAEEQAAAKDGKD